MGSYSAPLIDTRTVPPASDGRRCAENANAPGEVPEAGDKRETASRDAAQVRAAAQRVALTFLISSISSGTAFSQVVTTP